MHRLTDQFVDYCRETLILTESESYNYHSLPVCIVDCVYSLRAKYYNVTIPIVDRYATAYMGGDRNGSGDTISDFIKHIDELGGPEVFADKVVKNHQKLGGKANIPLQRTSNFDNELERAVFNYRKDITAYYVPLSTMFDALMPSQRLKNNIYYQMLQQKLVDGKWDTSKLCTQQFVAKGKDYAKNCRNEAAHSAALTEKKAQECMSKTKELLTEFLSAYNP